MTSDDKDRELKNLPALRYVKERLLGWWDRRNQRPPLGSLGRGAKEPDTDSPLANQTLSDGEQHDSENETNQ